MLLDEVQLGSRFNYLLQPKKDIYFILKNDTYYRNHSKNAIDPGTNI